MANRPLVQVQRGNKTQIKLPAVFTAPIRADIVKFVHTQLSKNNRQAYAVAIGAGEQTSAISWGTGRAVARIPRVKGSGTHRSGQAAFGNMCRGGRRFSPTKTWRRWHRKVNINQKRFAIVSALAASAVPALVMARGHRVDRIPEIPLVVDTAKISAITKTGKAQAFLKTLGAFADCERVSRSRALRSGKGKARNRRYVQRRGPLIVYKGNNQNVRRAFRNIPGIELAAVENLSLLQLAPGGHVGRFIIWLSDAFEALDGIYGTLTEESGEKKGYTLPYNTVNTADIQRIMASDAVQNVLRFKCRRRYKTVHRANPLKNHKFMAKLNPYATTARKVNLNKHNVDRIAKQERAAAKGNKAPKVRNPLYTKFLLAE